MVTTTTHGGLRVSICTCTQTGRHLATFTHRPGSGRYTLATEPPQVAASAHVSASGQVAASCSCRLLSHQTLLCHHSLGHPSLPRLRGMHSRFLISCLPKSLPPLPPSPALFCLFCVEGRQRATPHSSSFPPTTAPLQTLNMDVSSPAPQGFGTDLPIVRLHSDRGGEFSSDLLRDFFRGDGILQSFTLLDFPQQNGIAERHIGLVMEVARTSMIHAGAPHFLWKFAVRYAAHQLNLWPRVSLLETSPTLRWTGKVGDASVFWVWGSRAFVRDTSADKLSARAIPCVFLGFLPDAPGWQFYHPTSRRVLPSQDVKFDESVPFYRLFPYRSAPPPPPPLFLAPGPPLIDPLSPEGPAPSGVSQVDPLPGPASVQVAVDSGTQLSLRWLDYDLRQAPREWHNTLRTTLAALGFAPSTHRHLAAAVLRPHVLQRFAFHFSSPQPTPLSTSHSLSAPPSDKSVEPSGLYPKLVGCLMYLMTCTRPDLAYPLSLLARYVAPVVLTGQADASWVDDSATPRSSQGYTFSLGFGSVSWRSTRSSSVLSSSCEAEIYAGAMAPQELRWLTYLLIDLGEQPRLPPVLYVDNKAMTAL
ncbi:unnamed protein product [Closterium sp. NIES-54]